MQATGLLIETETKSEFSDERNVSLDYLNLINTYNILYVEAEEYFQVGSIPQKEGWVLYLSVIWIEYMALLQKVLPILASYQVVFKIPRDMDTVRKIQDGMFGVASLGKLVCIYLDTNDRLLPLAKTLVAATLEFKAPSIPGHRSLGGCVYTKYDSFIPLKVSASNSITSTQPEEIPWPFDELIS